MLTICAVETENLPTLGHDVLSSFFPILKVGNQAIRGLKEFVLVQRESEFWLRRVSY